MIQLTKVKTYISFPNFLINLIQNFMKLYIWRITLSHLPYFSRDFLVLPEGFYGIPKFYLKSNFLTKYYRFCQKIWKKTFSSDKRKLSKYFRAYGPRVFSKYLSSKVLRAINTELPDELNDDLIIRGKRAGRKNKKIINENK